MGHERGRPAFQPGMLNLRQSKPRAIWGLGLCTAVGIVSSCASGSGNTPRTTDVASQSGSLAGSGAAETGTTQSASGSTHSGSSRSGAAGSGASPSSGGQSGSGVVFEAGPPPADPCIEAGTCPLGQWIDVTPAGLNLVQTFHDDNFGAQDVVADPMRPNELYAFVCYQGVWKSTDYGMTWTGPINTGNGGSMVTQGKPWTAAIDNSPRDPSTPPTLWTAAAAQGVLKSTDGGVSWTAHLTHNQAALEGGGAANGNDAYAFDVDPYDHLHMLTGFHNTGLSESTDGGETWSDITLPANGGISIYPFFIDTGEATTTRGNWLTIPMDDSQPPPNHAGAEHTTDGGKTWTRLGEYAHAHGSSQLFNAGGGVAYMAVPDNPSPGVFKTTDSGTTWTRVSSAQENGVMGTTTALYASWGWADTGPWNHQDLQSASLSADTSWTPIPAPQAMIEGWKRLSVTFDGKHHILVGGFWLAGIWRYVEP